MYQNTSHLWLTKEKKRFHCFGTPYSDEFPKVITIEGDTIAKNGLETFHIHGDKESMWELATTLLDTLMEDELTEADLETMDKAAIKMGFVIQDHQVTIHATD